MKYLFDNNLPLHFAHAVGEFCKSESNPPQVIHLTDRFPASSADEVWISTLAKEGGWAIISQDRFNKNDLEREAVRQSGLVIFALAKGWSSQAYWDKAHNLVRWWPAIMDQSARITGGAAFRVPLKFSGKGKFEQIQL